MTDYSEVPENLVKRLQRRLADLPQKNELIDYRYQLEDDDYSEALVSALEEYNEEIFDSYYTFSNVPKKSLLLDLAVVRALEMMFREKLYNALAYSDSGPSVDELRKLPMYEQTIGKLRSMVIARLREAKNADALNAAISLDGGEGLGFEY